MTETNNLNGKGLQSSSDVQKLHSCLAALSEAYSVTLSIDEKSPDMQDLISENALLKEKLGEEIDNSEIRDLLCAYKENQDLRRKLAEVEIEGNDPGSFTSDLVNQQVKLLSTVIEVPETIQGDPDNLQKNLKLLAVLSYYWENYVSSIKSHMKNSLRNSQFSAFCMLASSKYDKNLTTQASEVLESTDKLILQSSYLVKDYLNSIDNLEMLKQDLIQKYKHNKVFIDLKEPILKQKALIDSCASFLKFKPVSFTKLSDWSVKTLEKGLSIQEKLVKAMFDACKQPHSESEVTINLLKKENMLLYALKEDKEVSLIDKNGDLEIIKQLTNQNKELLNHILNLPVRPPQNSLSKILQNLHADTEELDKELVDIQKEIESETVTPLQKDFSVEKLSNENYLLKKGLAQSEAQLLMMKQNKSTLMNDKLKEKDREIRNLTYEKQELMANIEKLKQTVNNLNVQVRNTKTVKEKYNQINLIHSQRESTVINMKQQLERQKLQMQNVTNENNKKKLVLIKNFKALLEVLKKYEPAIKHFQNIAEWEKDYEKDAEESYKEIESQNASLLEQIFKLEGDIRNSEALIKELNEDIALRQRIMKEIGEEVDVRYKIIDLEKEVNQKTDALQTLEEGNATLKANSARLQEKNTQLLKDNKLKVQSFNQMTKEIEDLQTEVTGLQSSLDQVNSENSKLKDNVKNLNLTVQENDKKLIESSNQLRIYEEKIISFEKASGEKDSGNKKSSKKAGKSEEESGNKKSSKKGKSEETGKVSSPNEETNPKMTSKHRSSSKKKKETEEDSSKKKKSSRNKNEDTPDETPVKTKSSAKNEVSSKKKPAKSKKEDPIEADEKKTSKRSKKEEEKPSGKKKIKVNIQDN